MRFFPTSPRRVCQPIREGGRPGVEHEPRGAHAVTGQHDRSRLLLLQVAVGVVVENAVRQPVLAHRYLSDAAVRLQLRSHRQRLGPVGDVGRGLGAARAADVAGAAVVAGGATVVGRGENRRVRRPPVPAQLIEPHDHRLPHRVQRDRWSLTLRLGRISGIAGHACHAHDAVVEIEEGLQFLIAHRPVVRHSVQRLRLEV